MVRFPSGLARHFQKLGRRWRAGLAAATASPTGKAAGQIALWVVATALVLAILSAVAGCGSSHSAAWSKAHKLVKAMSQEVEPRLAAECMKRAKACRAKGIESAQDCDPLIQCRIWKADYAVAVSDAQRSLSFCNSLYWDLKGEDVLK